MATGGFSLKRLARVREAVGRYVDAGDVPGAVAVVARRGEVHIEAMGNLAFEGPSSKTPMAADTICRMASMTKPIVAACAMTLVEDGTLRLDDPVDALLPELADMKVLANPSGPLEETIPATRSITLRDLLTYTLGTGMVVGVEPGTVPIADAVDALYREDPEPPPDEFIRRLGALPLVYQPGERWMYNAAADVTGVLVARATGMSFGDALRERIFEPLGMKDTAFSVPAASLGRLATAYKRDDATGELVVADAPDGYWSRPPAFESGGGGLVSTANDYLAFASALLAGGTWRREQVLSRPSVTLMTSDHLTPAQKEVSEHWQQGYFDEIGWGFGMSVRTRRTHLGPSVGSYGWPGLYGTEWCNDPTEKMTMILMIQRAHAAVSLPVRIDFWTAAYQAIDD
ncbi:MAG: beta-lactamase family protein [Chloroflexi bacterium]|nr:MAG: beta-lactamase family protein [Chloroflexota bacterium]TME02722.1 MAG: beta-lactamase family protein [Chloroflexota bacterium]TME41729.1 MAG: beta-lactamase family protein [Chloroflexota bacterium]TME49945.1 MAG: beta-lactamase family protein [Chloroflexota bacterium]